MHKNNFIILSCVVVKLLLVKHCKTSLPKNRPQMSSFRDVTKGPVCIKSMADNENSTSSYVALNNNLFKYAFVDCSTDIEVVITELLE